MRYTHSVARSADHRRVRTVAAGSEQNRVVRGVIHGLIISLAIWLAAGYLTIILR